MKREEEKSREKHIEHQVKTLRLGLILGGIGIVAMSIGIFPSLIYIPTVYMLIPLGLLVVGIIPIYGILFMNYKAYIEELEGYANENKYTK